MSYGSKAALVAGCATATLLAVGQAHAAPQQSGEALLEEIVVTAQKRDERLKDIPAAVTAVTGANLQRTGAAKLDDYVAKIPGLTVSNVSVAAASTQLTIRGVTTGVGGNPTVGIYIDDSPFGSSSAYGAFTAPDLDPQDLARVEVLRGPQGTLYGAGSMGGLLKYVTAEPDTARFFGRLQVDGSTVDRGGEGYGLRGAMNIPFTDQVALRISGYDREDPGYVDNILTGQKDVNKTGVRGGRASLGVKINDEWKARLSAVNQRQRGAGPVVDFDSVNFKPLYGDLKQAHARDADVSTMRLAAYSLQVDGDLGDLATLTSATAYNHQRMKMSVDLTAALGPVLAPLFGVDDLGITNRQAAAVEKFTQEVRLASPTGAKLAWQVGVFYTRESTNTQANATPIDALTGQLIELPIAVGHSSAKLTFEEKAAFGNVTYHFTSKFDVTAGVRYSKNSQRNLTANNGLLYGAGVFETSSEDSATTYLVNPRFRLSDNTMVYARFATGYRPGGPNIGLPGVPLTFKPDTVKNYEIGVKSDLFDRRVSLELAAYRIDWKDIQVQQVNANTGSTFIGNGGSAVSQGFEASGAWLPLTGLQLYANVACQDPHLTEDFPPGGAVGLDGDRLPLTARWTSAMGADYRFLLFADWNAQLGVDWHHLGRTLGAFPNPGATRFEHPAYDIVDLRAGVSNDRMTLQFYVKNVGNDLGQSADLNIGPFTRVAVVQPRTFGLSLSTEF